MEHSELTIRYDPQTGEPYIYGEQKHSAGFFVRLAAFGIDCLLVGAALLPVRGVLSLVPYVAAPFWLGISAMDIIAYILTSLYFVLMLKYGGATVGKRLFKLKVQKTEGELSWLDVIYRETVGKYLSSLLAVGYLMIGFSKDKRGLHDRLCDTEVVYTV